MFVALGTIPSDSVKTESPSNFVNGVTIKKVFAGGRSPSQWPFCIPCDAPMWPITYNSNYYIYATGNGFSLSSSSPPSLQPSSGPV